MPSGDTSCHVGVDENGLGARLGPLVVTAVLAEVTDAGRRVLERPLRGKIRRDLDDSKRLVSHSNVALGEAWARVLTGDRSPTPDALFHELSIESSPNLRAECPSHLEGQCWGTAGESFESSAELRQRIAGHVTALSQRGVRVTRVRVSSTCTQRLNRARREGKNRFAADLHAMESLLIEMRREVARDVVAVCGKVGGMSDYDRFFGPLSGFLKTELGVSPSRSSYYFHGLGEVHFVQDADARAPLVMLASLVGKYVRELLMARITRFHGSPEETAAKVSGYHDARTRAWVAATELQRRSLRVAPECFERERDVAS